MTFNQINYFLTVAKYLNFTRAATDFFVTQSTLSRSIHALETELGVCLLNRDYHSVELTAAGTLFYKEMSRLMNEVNDTIHRVQEVASNETERSAITLGLLDGQEVESTVLITLKKMSMRYPELEVSIRRISEDNLIDYLKKGDVDIVETILPAKETQKLGQTYYAMRQVRRYLVARKDDPIWEKDYSLRSLDGKIVLVMENRDVVTEDTKGILRDAGIAPKYKTARDTETLSLWLEAGMGYTIVNEGNIIFSSRAFRPLRAEPIMELPEISSVLVWNQDHVSPVLEMFLTFIRSDML